MIKAIFTGSDGDKMLLVGLSGENIARLMNNEPIKFELSELGEEAEGITSIAIMGGKTEDHILELIRKHIPESCKEINHG